MISTSNLTSNRFTYRGTNITLRYKLSSGHKYYIDLSIVTCYKYYIEYKLSYGHKYYFDLPTAVDDHLLMLGS
jgi:hypothetical protein